MTEEEGPAFPKTVFVKELPEDYTMTEVAEVAIKYGNILEMKRMDDALLVRFEQSRGAKKFTDAASGKKDKVITIRDHNIHVIPKRNRKTAEEKTSNDNKPKRTQNKNKNKKKQ